VNGNTLGNILTTMRSRALKIGLIVLLWGLAAAFVELRIVPYQWSPEIDWLRHVIFPGVLLMVGMGAIHGFGSSLIDNSIIIGGTTVFWSFLTIGLMALWSIVRRRTIKNNVA